MPSHGPTEPPDEDHGWFDEYDKIMESEEGKALLKYLFRIDDFNPRFHVLRADDHDDITPVETDDDALQAFVQMVYDRGIAHGYGNAQMEAGMVQMDEEMKRQDLVMHKLEISTTPSRRSSI